MQIRLWLVLGILVAFAPFVAATPEPYVCSGGALGTGVGVRNVNDGGFDTGCLPDSSTVAPCGTESDPGVRIYVGTHYTDCFNPSTIQGDVDMLVTLAECLAMNPTRPLNC